MLNSAQMEPWDSKLREAHQFLDRLSQVVDHREEFLFNLSAFLTALNSVFQTLRKRYVEEKGITGYDGWSQKKKEADALLMFLKKQRDDTVHRKTLALRTETTNGRWEYVEYLTELNGFFTIHAGKHLDEARPHVPIPPGGRLHVKTNYRWTFVEFPSDIGLKNDVLALCIEGLERAKQFATDAVKQYGV